MKRSSLVDTYSSRCVFFLLSFSIFFLTTTNAQVRHRRLWPWPYWPQPYPQPWPMDPPGPDPSPKPSPPPGPSPCPPPIPPKPQPKPPPEPSPSPCPPPIPPKPQPKPPPPKPQPKPAPPPVCPPPPQPKPLPPPCPPPTPKPKPPPVCPPTPPPKPQPKPAPPPAPKPTPCPQPPPKPPAPGPKPIPGPPPKPPPPKPQNQTIPAVFFFGDSIMDTGNNNDRKAVMKSNYRPYGIDFKSHVPTGRFSNGKVASDYISKYLGLKKLVPAYFDKKLEPKYLLTGVSFASGGAGYNPQTSKAAKAIPMLDQLTHFQDYIEKVNKMVKEDEENLEGLVDKANELTAKGVSIVNAGSNDLIITYYGSGAQHLKSNIDAYTTFIADSAASFVTQLYGYGARRIGVIGAPPLGCVPSQRKKKKKCNEELNYASQLFNSKLILILGDLTKTMPNSTVVYMDIYTIFSQILETPAVYGFEETKKSCCKTGASSGGFLCEKKTSTICSNTSSYLFWDGVHPTKRAYKLINKVLVQEYLTELSKK